jgi:hypothetical protein
MQWLFPVEERGNTEDKIKAQTTFAAVAEFTAYPFPVCCNIENDESNRHLGSQTSRCCFSAGVLCHTARTGEGA